MGQAVPSLAIYLYWREGKLWWARWQAMRMCILHLQLDRVLDQGPHLPPSKLHCHICVETMLPLGFSQQAMSTAGTLRHIHPYETWESSDDWLGLRYLAETSLNFMQFSQFPLNFTFLLLQSGLDIHPILTALSALTTPILIFSQGIALKNPCKFSPILLSAS